MTDTQNEIKTNNTAPNGVSVKRLVRLDMTLEQARTLQLACEIVCRLHMGQMDMLSHVCEADYDTLMQVKKMCFPDQQGPGQTYGIRMCKDEVTQLWDIVQVVRHHLSWRDQDNTPETRKWPEQMTVNFDQPMQTSDQPLPRMVDI